MAALGLVVTLLLPNTSLAGILSESDFKQAESLRPLFESLMKDLLETAKRPDIVSGDAGCINSTIRELLQISDELASYEYLITMEREMTDVGDDASTRDVIKFAVDKSSMVLSDERRRLVQVADQCAKYPLGSGKTKQALQVIDTTTGILASIRSRL
jgi:hypothetical protein